MDNNLCDYVFMVTETIKKKIINIPKIGLILGSGLGMLGNELENKIIIKYSDIPNFPTSTVEGHEGRFVFGKLEGVDVAVMQGRFHFYEGRGMKEIGLPILILKSIGIEKIIITNAAGGINKSFNSGDLMIINDHINFVGINPLIGKNFDTFGPRFPDMSNAYSKELIDMTKKICKKHDFNIKEGTYIFMPGPAYETPAEIRMARIFGADAVGMSTVPEVITAHYTGMKVLGLSCITNMAAGVLDEPLNHADVIATAESIKNDFIKLVRLIIKEI